MNETVPRGFDISSIMLDSLPFMAWLKDESGRYQQVNRFFCDYFGMTKSEIVDKTDFDLFPKEAAELYRQTDAIVLSGEDRHYFESCFKERWTEEYKEKICTDQGELIGIFGYARDITERKKTAEALLKSERSKAILISNLPGAAFRQYNDKDWTMTFLSQGCFDLTGYQPEELIDNENLSYNDLICPEFKSDLLKKWKEDVLVGRKASDEYTILTKSGEVKWVWEQSIPVSDKDGIFTESEGFILDISDIKNALKALNASEERFRAIFEEAPLGIAIFDAKKSKATQVNKKFAEILGRSVSEILSLSWKDYTHTDDIKPTLHWLNLLKQKKTNVVHLQKRYLRPDGSIVWINMKIVMFQTESGKSQRLCMVEDITEAKKRDDAIRYLSYHDTLTGLYNRAFFEEQQQQLDARKSVPISLIMGDLNGLKLVNDSFGHSAGDILLKEAGRLLQNHCREDDILARLGGDEFVILLPHTSKNEAAELCTKIYEAFERYNKDPERRTIYLSISLGHATKTNPNRSIEELMIEAEQMFYDTKNEKRELIRNEILKSAKAEFERKFALEHTVLPKKIRLAKALAQALSLSQAKARALSLLVEMHDIGKLTLPSEIQQKSLEEMSRAELVEYRKHCDSGHRIAMAIPELKSIADAILYHHEHWDGSGFPERLSREEIPLLSRIICVLDAYCERAHEEQQGLTQVGSACQHILKHSGSKYDPAIVNALVLIDLALH